MEELYRLIPDRYAQAINTRLCADKLCEVRIRGGLPVKVLYNGAYRFLCDGGVTQDAAQAFVASPKEAESVIMRACERSLYTVTDTLKSGYVAVGGGIRIGVCGSAVVRDGAVSALKDFTSVNIRIPHEIKGCANSLFHKVHDSGIRNTVIVSPPCAGKTTVLRDLCRIVSDRGYNVLLCDEKYELAAVYNGVPALDVGQNTDIMSGMDKRSAVGAGIAYMRPDVVMTDEVFEDDIAVIERAVHCGISVVCTAHAKNYSDLKQKPDYEKLVSCGVFTRFAAISHSREITVCDDGGNALWA